MVRKFNVASKQESRGNTFRNSLGYDLTIQNEWKPKLKEKPDKAITKEVVHFGERLWGPEV